GPGSSSGLARGAHECRLTLCHIYAGISTRFCRPLTTHGASIAVQSPCTFPSSLAGTGRLVVPTRPYVVRAAPGLAPNPGSGLPSTSTSHCDGRRRSSHPARNISASRRTAKFVKQDHVGTQDAVDDTTDRFV